MSKLERWTRDPVEGLEIGEGKRVPCTGHHGIAPGCSLAKSVYSYAIKRGMQVFAICRGGQVWIGRYG